jgi:hypothetical protein
VRSIAFKVGLLNAARDKLVKVGGSVIEPLGANPDTLISNIQLVDDLVAEIDALEEQRRCERAQFEHLIVRLESELQRQVIEAYYFYALSWREVANIIYGKAHERDKQSCRVARGRAINNLVHIKRGKN